MAFPPAIAGRDDEPQAILAALREVDDDPPAEASGLRAYMNGVIARAMALR